MNDYENFIQYTIPENVEMYFAILSHVRDVSLKLQKGVVDFCFKMKRIPLPLGQEFQLPVWENLWPYLKSKTVSDILVRGNHYVYFSELKDYGYKKYFRVSPSDESFSFVLENHMQLHVFISQMDSDIVVISTRGIPEINGHKMSLNVEYSLPPFKTFLIKSSNNEPFSVYVRGLERRVKLSMLHKNTHSYIEAVRDRIFTECVTAKKKFRQIGSTTLVLGPSNVGKSTFCHLLLNKAFDEKLNPVYIDLNIARNSTIPGSLSFTEIQNQVDRNLSFSYINQRQLHFGDTHFNASNIRFYYLLIRKMGKILKSHRKYSKKGYTLSVIDTCGTLGEDIQTTECLLQSFTLDMVVFIGDQSHYETLKHSILKKVPSEFISKPNDIEPWNELYESNYIDYSMHKQFYNPRTNYCILSVRIIKFEYINIYRIVTTETDRSAIKAKITDLKFETVPCDPRIENYVLAVSQASTAGELLPITEIQYYMCIKAVDMANKTVTALIPKYEKFTGGILLMSCLKLPTN